MQKHLSMGRAITFLLLIGTSSSWGSCARILAASIQARLEVGDAELKIQDQQLRPQSGRQVVSVKANGHGLEAEYAKLRLDEEARMPKPVSREAEAVKPKRRNRGKTSSQRPDAEAGKAKLLDSPVVGKPRSRGRGGRRPRGKSANQEAEELGSQEAMKPGTKEASKAIEASSEDPSELDALYQHEAEDLEMVSDALSEDEAEDAKVASQNHQHLLRSQQGLIENFTGPWKKVTIWCLSDLLAEDEVSEERQELVKVAQELRQEGLKLDVESHTFDREKKWSDRIHADASKDFDRPQFGCFVVTDSLNVGGHERGQEHGKYIGGYDEFVKAFLKNYCEPPSEIRESSLCHAFRAKFPEA